jgi:hypothetical protein
LFKHTFSSLFHRHRVSDLKNMKSKAMIYIDQTSSSRPAHGIVFTVRAGSAKILKQAAGSFLAFLSTKKAPVFHYNPNFFWIQTVHMLLTSLTYLLVCFYIFTFGIVFHNAQNFELVVLRTVKLKWYCLLLTLEQ